MRIISGLDLESTGPDPVSDRIVEIAIQFRDADTNRIVGAVNRRIDPEMHISAKAVQIHGIANADVMGCPTFKNIAPILAEILGKSEVVIAHNGEDFDLIMLVSEFQRVGVIPTVMPRVFDTMKGGRWATPDGKFPTLQELCWSLGIPYDKSLAHTALYDVEVMLDAYQKAKNIGIWT